MRAEAIQRPPHVDHFERAALLVERDEEAAPRRFAGAALSGCPSAGALAGTAEAGGFVFGAAAGRLPGVSFEGGLAAEARFALRSQPA